MADRPYRWRDPAAAPREWRLESRSTGYQGFYRVDQLQLSHELHAGGRTPVFDRELFVRGNVIGLLPWDRKRDEVVLIEQFRHGALDQQPDPWLVEIVAGMIDTDESPAQVAVREAQEEAGLTLDPEQLTLMTQYLTSPGASTEEVFVYLAETDLAGVGGHYGLAEESEDILVRTVKADDAIAMLASREIRNALSIVALQWFALYRAQHGIGGGAGLALGASSSKS